MESEMRDQDGDIIISGMREPETTGLQWLNPFTGELEPWFSGELAVSVQLQSAAKRIHELEEEIKAIKAFLVL